MSAPDRWFVLTAELPPNDPLRDLLADGMLELGGLSVLEDGGSLTTYLAPPPDAESFLEHARSFLAEWIADEAPSLSWRWQANEDWEREWKRGLQPRKVSPRFVVKPSWTEWSAASEEIVIEIDPQMAFGTGEHATTRSCLQLLDASFKPGDRVLDIGSGSGILSIGAAKLGSSEVIAVEYDPDANINARANIERNGVAGDIQLREELATPQLLEALGSFDLILANILSGVIRPLLPAFVGALRREAGRLIVSGILEREREDVLRDASAVGLGLRREVKEEEWWSAEFTLTH